ncbi:Hypothetical protein LEPBI_I2792 [Leptospira biflexa serovar Patoc strain 'Patoc 1 (Paris)']|uniref:Uncharacterized protein n=1 Tax=Leptospira biflexa serovar Patoc (strain Patoc 1 / ATCC 23582 / Paris) TaxID=456481 RepID=B0SNA2_LEPBP|nr:Hypothetical protein LEPBI_I2792 [Leptospira biflexa serovar Patoc strain 'Patoc 1 (Paris)']
MFCVPAILIANTTKIFSRIATYIYLISIPLILGTAFRNFLKGERQFLFFLISWGSYFIISYNTMFYLLGMFPYSTSYKNMKDLRMNEMTSYTEFSL